VGLLYNKSSVRIDGDDHGLLLILTLNTLHNESDLSLPSVFVLWLQFFLAKMKLQNC